MTDHAHLSLSTSSSPGRVPATLRPPWPWQVSSLRTSSSSSSTSSLDHRPSFLGSPRSTNSPGAHSSSSSLTWQPATTSRSAASTIFTMGNTSTNNIQEDSTRQWSFMGFEWVVRDVYKLRDYVESMDATETENPDFEILKQSPTLGDGKFKLEIAFTPQLEGSSDASNKPTLSLYITSLMVEFAPPEYELSASMMTAIKCQADRPGERGAPPELVWDLWQMDWVFRQEHEVWECPLPPLSTLLENSRIRDTDSFVICVQIQCPSAPTHPQQPSVYSVPRDLLEGLEASLDNANTGDVRFICLERLISETQPSPTLHPPDPTTPTSRRSSSSASSYSPSSSRTTARKRVIYAHSDILIRRSEYFATMLASSFSENPALVTGERKVYTIIVEEADFETIYWLLKFCYTNWLLFREQDDPRMAMDGVGVGWSAKWLDARVGEWDWKTFHKDDCIVSDTRSITSGESLHSVVEPRGDSSKSETLQPGKSTNLPQASGSSSSARTTPSTAKVNASRPIGSVPSPRRTGLASSSSPAIGTGSPTSSRTKPVPIPVTTTNFASSSRAGYPISPRGGRQHPRTPISVPDPHLHPTPAPRPASALSMYQVAHRYAMPSLAALALEHILSTITPQSSFALLLASSVWEELHSLVEDYVVEKWDEVSVSQEFEQCCQEVAAGEWGSEGGKTLMSIFRRLRSPNTMG